MPAILLSVIEMTTTCNYVRKFDYDSFRTGVNKLNHMFYFLTDQNIFLGGGSYT